MTINNSVYQLPITWQYAGSSNVDMVPFIGYSSGSDAGPPIAYTLPATMKLGDIFAVASVFNTFTITRNNANQKIYYNGNNGNVISTPNAGSTMFLICTLAVGGTYSLTVMDSSGDFTLT